jgi:hypothetical protein
MTQYGGSFLEWFIRSAQWRCREHRIRLMACDCVQPGQEALGMRGAAGGGKSSVLVRSDAEPRRAADSLQRPLLRRARFQRRLTPGVRRLPRLDR